MPQQFKETLWGKIRTDPFYLEMGERVRLAGPPMFYRREDFVGKYGHIVRRSYSDGGDGYSYGVILEEQPGKEWTIDGYNLEKLVDPPPGCLIAVYSKEVGTVEAIRQQQLDLANKPYPDGSIQLAARRGNYWRWILSNEVDRQEKRGWQLLYPPAPNQNTSSQPGLQKV